MDRRSFIHAMAATPLLLPGRRRSLTALEERITRAFELPDPVLLLFRLQVRFGADLEPPRSPVKLALRTAIHEDNGNRLTLIFGGPWRVVLEPALSLVERVRPIDDEGEPLGGWELPDLWREWCPDRLKESQWYQGLGVVLRRPACG